MKKRRISIFAALVLTALPLAGQTVTLDECLRLGLENDAAIKNSRLDYAAAKDQLSEARWEFVPRLSASTIGFWAMNPMLKVTVKDILGNSDAANEINNRIQEYAQATGIKTSYTALHKGFGAAATVVQPLYAGGRIVNGNRLASIGVQAAGLQTRIKERQESSEIERKYWSVVALQEKMATLRQAKALLDTLCGDADAAVSAGLMVQSDVREVRERINELKAAEIKLKGGLRLAKMDLFNTVGYKYSRLAIDDIILSDTLSDLKAPSAYVAADQENAACDESSLLSMQVEAKQLAKKMSVGESLPQLMVGANYSYSNMLGNDHMRSNLVGFVSLQIPITDLGKASHRAKRLEREVEKARNDREYLDAQLVLRRQMQQLEMETAWEMLQLSQDKVTRAEEDSARAEADFRSGRRTLSDLLRAELDLRSAREELINSRISYRNAVRSYLDSSATP